MENFTKSCYHSNDQADKLIYKKVHVLVDVYYYFILEGVVRMYLGELNEKQKSVS